MEIDPSFWNGRRVFITGHTGFKGSWLSIWLSMLGARVFGFALEPPTDPSLFREAKIEAHFESSVTGDVRDPQALRQALADSVGEVVFHMAAQSLVRQSYSDPLGTYMTNVMGTAHLLEAARSCESVKAIVNVTTDKVYENREWIWPYREDDALGGRDPYSNSKACSELVTRAFRDSFLLDREVFVATARSGNVIGGGDWAADRLIPDCLRAFRSGGEVRIRYPQATRPWQHVLEPLSGYLLLAEALRKDGRNCCGAWNFATDKADVRSVEWVVRTAARLWGNGVSYRSEENESPHEAMSLSLENAKATSRLGWKPKWNVERALEMTVEWTKQYYAGMDPYQLCKRQIELYATSL